MILMEYSKSKKKSQNNQINVQNQKLIMKISSSKNGSGIASHVILLGGVFITAALGFAFLVERKGRKSTQRITKKEKNGNFEDESSKGPHFLLPDSSPCIEQQQPSSNGVEKLSVNDSTSLFSTPCSIQDEKPKLERGDEKRDSQNAIASNHPKEEEEEESPSFERLPIDKEELESLDTKISLLPDPDQEPNEVSKVGIEVIQGNEKTEVADVHQALATIVYNPSQVDNKIEFLIDEKHNDKGEVSELQHTGKIDKDKHKRDLIQEQEKQEIFNPDGSLPESSTSCEQQVLPVQLYNLPLFEHENLTSDFDQEDQVVEAIEFVKTANEDEDKDHRESLYFEEQCTDAEIQIDQFAKKRNLQLQFSDEEECSQEIDQVNSCYEEVILENSPLYLGASEVRNASDQHSAEVIQVIKETNAMDTAASGEHSLEAVHSHIQLVEKQSFEHDCQGNGSEDDIEASETLAMDAVVVEKDLEARSREVKDELEESVFVHEEEEDVDKDDVAEEVEDDISEGAENSSEQSNSKKIWPADSNQELLLKLKEKKVKEEEEGMKTEDEETCCNSKSTWNEFDITSCQQTNDGKDDSVVNVTERYRTKLMNLDDVAAITRGRRVLLGGLLALIWYLCLKAFSLPTLADSKF
ncbi:uncharacterized protein LOC107783231 [Nicotiana tabacum]|uniref:uncharacterized protein LOC107783231 n=1 Tax=Nicotiana tabacum TaxID=4097 RepID=UPI003F4F3247